MQHYSKTNGGLKPGEAIKSYFGAIPDHLRWVPEDSRRLNVQLKP
jgi:hypothetical protein